MKPENKEFIENIRKERQQKKLEKKKAYDEQVAKQLEIKNERKESKKKLKTEIKNKKKKIKEIKKQKKQSKINATKEIKDKKELNKRLEEIKENYTEEIIEQKNDIVQLKFDYGKKYNTLTWKLFKWAYGIRKEFNRIIWSPPINTFKYLLIIIIIVLLLSGIFMAINEIVNRFLS